MAIPQIDPGQAVSVNWTAERYHADTHTVSRGGLVDLIRRPAYYHARYEARAIRPDPSTPAQVFGTAAHLAILEPSEYRRRVNSQSAPDAIYLKGADVDRIEQMRRNVLRHDVVAALLTNPHVAESTVLWRPAGLRYHVDGEEHDVDLVARVRPDLLVTLFDDEPVAYVVDLKTTRDAHPDEFTKEIASYRYHMQAAMYRDAVAALFGGADVRFLFIAVSKAAPHEVAIYDLDDAALELGRQQYESAMIELMKRRHTGDWTARWQRSIHILSLPRWAFSEDR